MNEPPFKLAAAVNSSELKNGSDGLRDIHEFKSGSSNEKLAFCFVSLGRELTIFEHTVSSPNFDHQSSFELKVAKAKFQGLPEFRLQKRTLATRAMAKILEVSKVNNYKYVEMSHQEFSRKFILSCCDEARVRSLLTSERLKALAMTEFPGEIVSNLNYLVYFEQGVFSDDSSYDSFISRANSAFNPFEL